ncbi:MAG: SpoIIE family protein phosphatase [Firmicutes bacterium]|nr:SpoIIE family protein phosphatase [Bacillota bacterium]
MASRDGIPAYSRKSGQVRWTNGVRLKPKGPRPVRRQGTGYRGAVRSALNVMLSLRHLLSARSALFAGVGFAAASAVLFGAYVPFGIVAVASSLVAWRIPSGLSTLSGALAASWVFRGRSGVLALGVSSVLFFPMRKPLRNQLVEERAPQASWAVGASVLICSFAGTVLSELLLGSGIDTATFALVESAVAGIASAFVIPATLAYARRGMSRAQTAMESTCFLIGLSAICAGLDSLSVFGVSPGRIAALFTSGFVGFVAGPGAGAVGGAALGLVLSMSRTGSVLSMGALALAGLMVGSVRGQGRAVAGFILVLSAVVVGFQFSSEAAFSCSLIEAAGAMILFLAIPRRLFSSAARFVPDTVEAARRERAYTQRVHYIISQRLAELGNAFGELAEAFAVGVSRAGSGEAAHEISRGQQGRVHSGAAANTGEPDSERSRWLLEVEGSGPTGSMPMRVAQIVSSVRERACSGCPRYSTCWGDLFFKTCRDLVDVLALFELNGEVKPEDLPAALTGRCARTGPLVEAANEVAGCTLRAGSRVHVGQEAGSGAGFSLSAAAEVFSLQMDGVSRALNSMSEDIGVGVRFEEDIEREIKERLGRLGISVSRVSVSRSGGEALEVRMWKRPCQRDGECVKSIAPIVARVVGRPLSVWSACCPHAVGGAGELTECSIRLLPTRKYDLETEVVKIARHNLEVSGDTHLLRNLGDGRMAIILADGMGVGTRASQESGAAAATLARLLETGLEVDFAVQAVNMLMLLRSRDESFTTLDLAVVDLYTGEVEMVKAGAPPSLIKHGKEVVQVGAPSLPAGVKAPMPVNRFKRALRAGDVLIMVTDGVIEARRDMADRDQRLIRAVQQSKGNKASDAAKAILDWAQGSKKARVNPADDMTVLTARLIPVGGESSIPGLHLSMAG